MKIDKKLIKELSENLDEFNLTEISYSNGITTIKVGKASGQVSVVNSSPAIANEKKVEIDPSVQLIKSPMVGTAYLSPEPGAKPFASIGKKVKKGETILIIEAMKTMNHIQASVDGEIIELLVSDGEAIEYDQILAKIK
jgi:acetyl-CoA carboxylase biotin carboxyl carrier protein